jgi:phosphate transport system substrate-binding protein
MSTIRNGSAASSAGSSTDASNGEAVSLIGTGSTFVNPFFSQAFAQYSKDRPNVKVNYQSIGSGGIKQFTAKTVDFGASDVPMNKDELAGAQQANGNVVQIPVALGAEAIVYNLPEIKSGLKLTSDAIAGIFLGKITKWNDPTIASKNSDLKLPDQDIAVVHRSDGSGTTYIFTDYLANISPEWKQGPGTGKEVAWPVGVGGKGNEGVAAQVQQAPGGIGTSNWPTRSRPT